MATKLTDRTGENLVDVHAHFAPPIPDDRRPAILAAHQRSNFLFPPATNWTPELAIEFMDDYGIRAQMLSNPNQLTGNTALRFNDFGANVVADLSLIHISEPTRQVR